MGGVSHGWAGIDDDRRHRESAGLAGILPPGAPGVPQARCAQIRKQGVHGAGRIDDTPLHATPEAMLLCLVRRLIRPEVERQVPPLREVLQHTSYETGRKLAEDTPVGTRVRSGALHQSDSAVVDGVWSSLDQAHFKEHGWYDSAPLCEAGGIKLTRKDLCSLAQRTWLNDEVVNAYCGMLCHRASQVPDYPSVHALSSHWFTRLAGTTAASYNYASVKRWTRKIDVFSFDRVLIPINWSANHWTLAVVYNREYKIVFYDSLGSRSAGELVLGVVSRWLRDERKERQGIDAPVEMQQFPGGDTAVPQQHNAHDCGVFACGFANSISAGRPLGMAQEHATHIRQRMVLELLEGRVPVPL